MSGFPQPKIFRIFPDQTHSAHQNKTSTTQNNPQHNLPLENISGRGEGNSRILPGPEKGAGGVEKLPGGGQPGTGSARLPVGKRWPARQHESGAPLQHATAWETARIQSATGGLAYTKKKKMLGSRQPLPILPRVPLALVEMMRAGRVIGRWPRLQQQRGRTGRPARDRPPSILQSVARLIFDRWRGAERWRGGGGGLRAGCVGEGAETGLRGAEMGMSGGGD